MLIRELEQETGLERATIRFYEKEGLISPKREENGYRTYSRGDCEALLKIKLLRQLGMPLDKIKNLQQGSVTFTDALNDQIGLLEKQINESIRSKEVCMEIRNRVLDYSSLDARYYLDMLTKPSANVPKWEPKVVPEFHPTTPVHPWKRYFARNIDLVVVQCILQFLLTVVLRIRPINGVLYDIIGFAIVGHLLLIPIEGLLLHYFGTTPGKWIFGIRVESVNGGTLSVSAAMLRSWNVLCYGYGFTIPIFSLWRQYKSYREYKDTCQTVWDREYDAEIHFDYSYSMQKKVAIGFVAIVFVLCELITVNDGFKPVHRGDDLTVEQIAENYNDLLEMMAIENGSTPSQSSMLTPEGKWMSIGQSGTHNGAVVVIGPKVTSNAPPEFVVENGSVRKIIYHVSYEDIVLLDVFGAKPSYLIISVAMAQDWMSIINYEVFGKQLNQAIRMESGSFQYENIELSWKTITENCIYSGNRYYEQDPEKESALDFTLEITIHNTD